MNDLGRPNYDLAFVRSLFDEMAATYHLMNLVSSFGFAAWWRRQCILQSPPRPGQTVIDLMTGMGELLPGISRRLGPSGSLLAIDLSPVMCAQAQRTAARCGDFVQVVEGDALDCDVLPASADLVISSFGLKTLSADQTEKLAARIFQMLKPGGAYSLLEISIPPWALLRWPYLFYLERIIPRVGRAFLGNPDNYRMLSVYTQAFGSCSLVTAAFEKAGLTAHVKSYFFGCATGLVGQRPV